MVRQKKALPKVAVLIQMVSEEDGTIKAMCDKVATALSEHYENVKKGVNAVMGGKVLDYEAKRIQNDAFVIAVINMLKNNVPEKAIRECYPDQFEAGKAKFMESQTASAE